MAKINIPPIKGGFNLSQINNAFKRIADELNDKVHYRDNPEGEPNQIKTDVDMNGQRLYNLPKPTEDHEAARYEDFKAVEGSANKAHEQADRAEAEADRAEREADRAFDAAVYGGADNLKVYETLDLATAAAAMLPDGQAVVAPDVDGRLVRYGVENKALFFKSFIGTVLSGESLDVTDEWSDIPEVSADSDLQILDSNAQAQALANRTEYLLKQSSLIDNAVRGSYAMRKGPANTHESVVINHTRNSYCTYDLITLRHSNWQTLRKLYPDGATPENSATTPLGATPMEFAKSKGLRVVVNADGGRAVSGGLRPIGLQISDGVLYQDWIQGETFTEAIVMMDDGSLVQATSSDGVSGGQWVAAGARWSAGFGWTCVLNGEAINLDSKPAPFDGSTISARTVIGQKDDGVILIALVEGRTGVSGITATKCGELMASLGCRIAHVLDGGGSTQCWWGDCYAMPSSDSDYSSERAVPAFLSIDLPVSQYDSGWKFISQAQGITANGAGFAPIAVRQRGASVQIGINAVGSFAADTGVQLSAGVIPPRYSAPNAGLMRVSVSGGAGYGGHVYAVGGVLYVRAGSQALTFVAGNSQWPVKHSGLPAVL